jgi:aspartate-semialdehyde dehydrogenase
MEDGGRNQEDSRSQDQADRDLRSCAGVCRPFGSGQYRVEQPITANEAREILRNAPGCLVIDKREDGGYVTPYECVGEDATYISRIREDVTIENGLQMWIVSDNLRKGAALNAVQIAECLVNRKLIQAKRRAA